MFDLIDAAYGLAVGGIAAQTPYGVGRIEDDAAFLQDRDGLGYGLSECFGIPFLNNFELLL
jgi:hypothetical protein